MTTATDVSQIVHLFTAALWTGSVLFFALGVLPIARDALTGRLRGRFMTLSRASALVLLLTGGHLAGTLYGDGRLTGTGAGHLVLGMVALWLALIGVLEVANARVDGETVGPTAVRLFQLGGLLSALLLVDAGLLLTAGP